MIKRTKLIIYTDHLINLRFLRSAANLQYYSNTFHYAVVYVNESEVPQIMKQLKQNRRIKKVEISPEFNEYKDI
ncbi:DUF2129 domain-containing protein [Xylocopilactobacillus apis]|uniref:DUF2129 domain-containing protein n=1 Tax=Xylocopilactobacillus apis TaxID=2932183 RepID=A0AAU9CT68_9LACO|nr:DUF2129 domain-containing protein [Xylocopilactobacillus apis]BDR57202.1 hypothetical protein KIMC2_17640 [Xylocopilactobacillus apis]